jgi:hypothetical protein
VWDSFRIDVTWRPQTCSSGCLIRAGPNRPGTGSTIRAYRKITRIIWIASEKKEKSNKQANILYILASAQVTWILGRWRGCGWYSTHLLTHPYPVISLYRSSAFHVCRRPPLQTPLARNPSQIFSSFLSLKQKRNKKKWDVFSLSGGRLGFRIGNDDDGLGERCAHLNRWWLLATTTTGIIN